MVRLLFSGGLGDLLRQPFMNANHAHFPRFISKMVKPFRNWLQIEINRDFFFQLHRCSNWLFLLNLHSLRWHDFYDLTPDEAWSALKSNKKRSAVDDFKHCHIYSHFLSVSGWTFQTGFFGGFVVVLLLLQQKKCRVHCKVLCSKESCWSMSLKIWRQSCRNSGLDWNNDTLNYFEFRLILWFWCFESEKLHFPYVRTLPGSS